MECLLAVFCFTTVSDDVLPERDALVLAALITALTDSSVLVLRLAFDLLLQRFPLHQKYVAFSAPHLDDALHNPLQHIPV